MTRISIQPAPKKGLGKLASNFATIGALGLLTLTAGTGHAATPSQGPQVEIVADRATAEQVYDALNADPIYYFRHVDVQVHHRVATLSGYVSDTPSIYRAREIAAGVPGVKRVVDQLELQRDAGP